MHKLTLHAAVMLSLAFGFATTAGAMMISPSVPILMIDGNGDSNTTVDFYVGNKGSGYDFGYYDSSGFNLLLDDASISASASFAGGEIVDFAIQDTVTGQIYKLSDGDATLDFTQIVSAANSQNPVVPFDYYQRATITWTIGNKDLIFDVTDPNDGFAPSVPEPTAALLFGLGFAVFERVVRRNKRR